MVTRLAKVMEEVLALDCVFDDVNVVFDGKVLLGRVASFLVAVIGLRLALDKTGNLDFN